MKKQYKVGSLFAGVGGICLGVMNGLMSIYWTQKVKLFYDTPLANNSH